jgi:hypothetical protein
MPLICWCLPLQRAIRPASAVGIVLLLTCTATATEAQHLKGELSGDAEVERTNITSLQEQKVALLREAISHKALELQAGRATLGDLLRYERLLLEAELEMAESPEQRIAILESLAASARLIETQALRLVEAGRTPVTHQRDCTLHRLDVEIELAKERSGTSGVAGASGRDVRESADPASASAAELDELQLELRRLAQVRVQAARDAVAALALQAADLPELTSAWVELETLWAKRLAEAEIAMSDDPAAQTAALKEYVNRVQEMIQVLKMRGEGRPQMAMAIYELANAQYRLTELKGRQMQVNSE